MHFLSLTIRCVIKSIVLHLKSLAGLACRKAWNGQRQAPLHSVPWLTSVSSTEPKSTQAPVAAHHEHSSLRDGQERTRSSVWASKYQSQCEHLSLALQTLPSAAPQPSAGRKARLPEGVRVKLGTQGLLISKSCLLFLSFSQPYLLSAFPSQ